MCFSHRFLKQLISYSTLLLAVACSTKPVTPVSLLSDQGIWEGKVVIRNAKTRHHNWVNVVWVSDSATAQMRVDVTAALGVPVATLMKAGDNYHLWLFLEQKHIISQNGKKLFRHLTKLSMDPQLFFQLLGQMRVEKDLGPSWSCTRADGLSECESKELAIQLKVENPEEQQRRILIVQDNQSIQMRLNRSKVEVNPSAFKPLELTQFKTIRI